MVMKTRRTIYPGSRSAFGRYFYVGVGLLAALALVLLGGSATPASAQALSAGKGTLRVMTYNVDEGTDYIEVLSATTYQAFLDAVTLTLQNIQATDPPSRAVAIAREIAGTQPHLISLQEATLFRTGYSPYDMEVKYDLLQLILDELARQGQHYAPIAVVAQLDVTVPSSTGLLVQATQRNAILARTDLDPADFQLSNIQTAHFATNLTITNPILGTITVPRAWATADVTFHGATFRYLCTHLESFSSLVQIMQGLELISPGGPLDTSMPVIFAADTNSVASDPRDPTYPTYANFLSAGFTDAWTAANPGVPGYTWGQAPLLTNPVSSLFQRIDLILVRGGWAVRDAELVGADPADKTTDGLWPSDHAGVVARLHLSDN
jgi:endonuclease/exonuclease/phosphatase family metal-dependent hydrolase